MSSFHFLSLFRTGSISIVLFFFVGCSPRLSDSYVREYQYLRDIRESSFSCQQFQGNEEYFLAILVDARHLDYSSPEAFFMSMRYGLFLPQEPTIGHAWVILSGKVRGKPWRFEGGHTGEFGLTAPKYFDEVIFRSQNTADPNPVQYLFSSLPDGCLQKGSGGHSPTFSVVYPLTRDQFREVYKTVARYNFSYWSLQDHQCVHFVLSCLSSIGVSLSLDRIVHIPKSFVWNNDTIRLWQDLRYAELCFATPDSLEKALFSEVKKKRALVATKWYWGQA